MVQAEESVGVADAPEDVDVSVLAAEFEGRSAEAVLRWALERFGSRVAIVTSFQAEGMVILDIAHRIDPGVRVITVDTRKLPQETYDLMDRVSERYGIRTEVFYPDEQAISEMVGKHGANLFYDSVSLRLLCCHNRKVEPLNRALEDVSAWVTGVRRSQSATRTKSAKIEVDAAHGGVLKLNPLADWTHEQVWEYVRANQVPYNALYDKGYTSIGCEPCTRAIKPGEDLRAGRWWWENGMPKECGIHVGPAWGRTT